MGWYLGERLLAVLLHHRAQEEVFLGGATILIDGGIIVVRGDIRSKARGVGTRPMAKGGTAVSHIERETDALGEHLIDAIDHITGRTSLMIGPPLIEPTAPELRTHLRGIRAQFAQAFELFIDIRPCPEVHGPHQILESILLEVRCPVALEQHYPAGVRPQN